MPTMRAMTITADNLLPRPKCGCDGGYDMAVKGLSVVVFVKQWCYYACLFQLLWQNLRRLSYNGSFTEFLENY